MLANAKNRGMILDTRKPSGEQAPAGTEDPLRTCDFCGDRVLSVRRVALDQEYDRLQKIHKEQYSCSSCFDSKEQARLGLARR